MFSSHRRRIATLAVTAALLVVPTACSAANSGATVNGGVADAEFGLADGQQREGSAAEGDASSGDVFHVDGAMGTDTRRPGCPGGTAAHPWRTIEHGMRCLGPGDELVVHGGTYTERVLPVIRPGRKDAPITVRAAEGERVVVKGLIRLAGADYWRLDGIDVTNDGRPYDSGAYLVKFRDGVGWELTNAEIWDATSYAALRIETSGGAEPAEWRVAGNCVHDTARTHGPGQDHNIYVSTGLRSGGGVIERNLVFDAVNGTNVKLGRQPDPAQGTSNVVVRHNTMWNAVQNVLAAGGSANNRVAGNLLGGVIRPEGKSWYPNIRGIELVGRGNVAEGNLSAGTQVLFNDPASQPGWRDGGGNRGGVAPRFEAMGCGGFRPSNPEAEGYGRYADQPTPSVPPRSMPDVVSLDAACPETGVLPNPFTDVDPGSTHGRAILCVAQRGLAKGRTTSAFAPAAPVDRGQMAAFLTRLLDRNADRRLPVAAPNAFNDDDGTTHEDAIDRLAAAGIVGGIGDGGYGPARPVTRQQMAAFLVGALAYASGEDLPADTDWFVDDDGTTHEPSINRAAAAGVTGGVAPGHYGPSQVVRRGQMATFLARVVGLL